MRIKKSLGLMSGTSMDGVDVALLETDGETIKSFGPSLIYPYSEEVCYAFHDALAHTKQLYETGQLQTRLSRPGFLAEMERQVTDLHIKAIDAYLKKFALDAADIDCIGFHGQTVLHQPEHALTIQLGLGQELANAFQTEVVYDFRADDVAAGGQGAPLASIYHRALTEFSNLERPIVVVNLGGVANVTWIGPDNTLIAFDTGPANALLDDWIACHTGERMDKGGAYAAKGTVDQTRLANMLDNSYFDLVPPKSLDRLDFPLDCVTGLSLEDGAATLTEFTAHSLVKSLNHMPSPPKLWIISGGGVHNPHLLKTLRYVTNDTDTGDTTGTHVKRADDLGWRPDFIEAEAFAFLAARSVEALPISFPGTTGVKEPMRGGIRALPQ